MLPAARRAKTLVVVQGLTRRTLRCSYFSKAWRLEIDETAPGLKDSGVYASYRKSI